MSESKDLMKIKSIFFILTVIFSACTVDMDMPEEDILTSPFFPIEIGKKNEYQITHFTYSTQNNRVDTNIYFLKEVIQDTYKNGLGENISIIDRFTKQNLSDSSWEYLNSSSVTISQNQAIRTDGNFRFVKLQLPIEKEKEWDGNQFFDDKILIDISGQSIQYYLNWTSKYIGIDEQVDIMGTRYKNVTTVQIADYENRLELRKGIERYAPNIGLIYSEIRVLDTQCFSNCENVSWEEKAEKGEIIIQQILNKS